jgi:hypothetical protein
MPSVLVAQPSVTFSVPKMVVASVRDGYPQRGLSHLAADESTPVGFKIGCPARRRGERSGLLDGMNTGKRVGATGKSGSLPAKTGSLSAPRLIDKGSGQFDRNEEIKLGDNFPIQLHRQPEDRRTAHHVTRHVNLPPMIAADSRPLLIRSAQALLCGAEEVAYARINPDQQALSLVSVEEAVAPSDLDRAEQLVRTVFDLSGTIGVVSC